MSKQLHELESYTGSLRRCLTDMEIKGGNRRVMLEWLTRIEQLAGSLDDEVGVLISELETLHHSHS